ncbi:Arc family DNA-binding protein [Haematobacter massiliensis]|nr:Arc family DNA-binding protein [Haematobacter massiliensis]OWJ83099.1 hypothetical protein CDV51_16255 [Haematobacter massiliensis]
MSTIPTNRESDRFMLRLPDGMRDRIKAAAEANSRSMNAEIVARLDASFIPPPDRVTVEAGETTYRFPSYDEFMEVVSKAVEQANKAMKDEK